MLPTTSGGGPCSWRATGDDEVRARRLAEIRARRGTPERQAAIERIEFAKGTKASSAAVTGGRKTPENSQEMLLMDFRGKSSFFMYRGPKLGARSGSQVSAESVH